MTNLPQLMSDVDAVIQTAIERTGQKMTCSKGCFACCAEPVYGTRQEVELILSTLTPEQIEILKPKVRQWLDRFIEAGYMTEEMPNAFKYRLRNLWCPLLASDGACGVYQNRPIECRLHFTNMPREGCEKPELRPQQKYGGIPKLTEHLAVRRMNGLEEGESECMDHLCILLAEKLLGFEEATPNRMVFTKKNGEIEGQFYSTKEIKNETHT